MKFTKMHGCGNDFVIFDGRDVPVTFTPPQIRDICNRKTGVGCDQLIIMLNSEKADVFMDMHNADGTPLEACGNATRCVADLVDATRLETVAGVLHAERKGDLIAVDMGKATFPPEPFTDNIDGMTDPVIVNMGNPHAVFYVDDLGMIRYEKTAKAIEHHPFFPNRTNVEFVKIIDRNTVFLRTWERGVGLTLACGSAACATVAAGVHLGATEPSLEVQMDGGTLHMEYRQSDGHVIMTGPTAYVFDGTLKTV